MRADPSIGRAWRLDASRPEEGTLVLRLSGSWRLGDELPSVAHVRDQIAAGPSTRRLAFDTAGVTAWDTGLLTFVVRLLEENANAGIEADRAGLPEGARRLLALAAAVPERRSDRSEPRGILAGPNRRGRHGCGP